MDRPHILFDVIPKDWERPSSQIIAQRIAGQLHPGAIILLHDGGGERSNTVSVLELILAHMKKNGYQILTVTEFLKLDEKRKIK
jgi:peptidoglycan/xylan/chitin deacetylase (PgdA/CDA1 family)